MAAVLPTYVLDEPRAQRPGWYWPRGCLGTLAPQENTPAGKTPQQQPQSSSTHAQSVRLSLSDRDTGSSHNRCDGTVGTMIKELPVGMEYAIDEPEGVDLFAAREIWQQQAIEAAAMVASEATAEAEARRREQRQLEEATALSAAQAITKAEARPLHKECATKSYDPIMRRLGGCGYATRFRALALRGLVLSMMLSPRPCTASALTSVSLHNMGQLVFNNDKLTTAWRTAPVHQLRCRGDFCDDHAPQTVRCINTAQGIKQARPTWSCVADGLDPRLKLVGEEVRCEPDETQPESMVLDGSCALEHGLENSGRSAPRTWASPSRSSVRRPPTNNPAINHLAKNSLPLSNAATSKSARSAASSSSETGPVFFLAALACALFCGSGQATGCANYTAQASAARGASTSPLCRRKCAALAPGGGRSSL